MTDPSCQGDLRKTMNNEEKKRLTDAVRIWCWWQGFTETPDKLSPADLVFKSEEKTVGFVIFDEQTEDLLSLETGCDFTYAVISDPAIRQAAQKKIPAAWGILGYGNPYGLGYLYQVWRKAKA